MNVRGERESNYFSWSNEKNILHLRFFFLRLYLLLHLIGRRYVCFTRWFFLDVYIEYSDKQSNDHRSMSWRIINKIFYKMTLSFIFIYNQKTNKINLNYLFSRLLLWWVSLILSSIRIFSSMINIVIQLHVWWCMDVSNYSFLVSHLMHEWFPNNSNV